jgi:hypothetical protein
VHISIYIYIDIYIEREREKDYNRQRGETSKARRILGKTRSSDQ